MQTVGMTKAAISGEDVGGVLGAALPAASLGQYLAHDLPRYHNMVSSAPEFRSYRALAKQLRLGDVGLAGAYRPENASLGLLNYGSLYTAGGPGTHGQIVGPRSDRYRVDGEWWGKSQLTPKQLRGAPRQRVPTMWHGGAHAVADYRTPTEAAIGAVPNALSEAHAEGVRRWQAAPGVGGKIRGYLGGLAQAPRRAVNFYAKSNKLRQKVLANRGKGSLLQMADTSLDDIQHYGKQQRPYLFMRSKHGPIAAGSPEGKALVTLLRREAAGGYDVPGAVWSGIRNLFVPRTGGVRRVPTLQQELGFTGGNVAEAVKRIYCDASGHHCGSLPTAVLQRLNLADRRLNAGRTLPSQSLLSDDLVPVGVVHKAKMLRDLRRAAVGRTLAGVGATGVGVLGGQAIGRQIDRQLADFHGMLRDALKRKAAG